MRRISAFPGELFPGLHVDQILNQARFAEGQEAQAECQALEGIAEGVFQPELQTIGTSKILVVFGGIDRFLELGQNVGLGHRKRHSEAAKGRLIGQLAQGLTELNFGGGVSNSLGDALQALNLLQFALAPAVEEPSANEELRG